MTQKPFVTLNIAMTADGKTDTIARRGAAISSALDYDRVDRLRAGSDAILVGGHTLLGDDPRLVVKSAALRQERLARGADENPVKVAVVTRADLRPESRFLSYGPARIVIFTTAQTPAAQVDALRARGVEVWVSQGARVDLVWALAQLSQMGIQRLLVEGGGMLNEALLRGGLVDEMYIYIAPLIFGGATAPTFASGPGLERDAAIALSLNDMQQYSDGGILLHYTVIK